MQGKYKPEQIVYIIQSNKWILEAKVLKYSGGFYTLKFSDSEGGVRLRESRIFASKEDAEAKIRAGGGKTG